MFARLVRLVIGAALFAAPAAVAQEPAPQRASALPMPQIARCERLTHPQLPPKWRATFFLAPFSRAQLALAEITHESAIATTRIRLYGLERGAADLLIVGSNTYVLRYEGQRLAQCRNLGDTGWRSLPADWLPRKAQCVGSAPITETGVEWWQVPTTPSSPTDWIWFKASDRTPFRLLFERPSDRLAALSSYALSYRVSFTPLSETDLASVVAACKAQDAAPPRAPRAALAAVLAGMADDPGRADADIGRLMPEFERACAAAPLPDWPEHFAATAFMTTLDADAGPLPAEVVYDWPHKSLLTRMFRPRDPRITSEDALLRGTDGYTVQRGRSNRLLLCEGSLPGAVKANWTTTAPCACVGTIKGQTPLTPYGTTRILRCPMTAPRVVWAWFTQEGRPTLFMETATPDDAGPGQLAVVDYQGWAPDRMAVHSVFDLPKQCPAPPATPVSRSEDAQCPACHLAAPQQ